MRISSGSEPGTNRVTIHIEGRFDFSTHAAFHEAYSAHPEGTRFTVDLSQAVYLDSSALGMLLLLRRHAGDVSDAVELSEPQPAVRRLLRLAKFERFFRMAGA